MEKTQVCECKDECNFCGVLLNSPSLCASVLPYGATALREAEEAEGRAGESRNGFGERFILLKNLSFSVSVILHLHVTFLLGHVR